jgi:hypothetical protein
VAGPLIPYSAFTDMRLHAVATRLGNSQATARFAQITMNLSGANSSGGGRAHLIAALRDRGDWKAEFGHHAHWYRPRDIRILSAFLGQVARRGQAARLGDPELVSRAVDRLRRLPRAFPKARRLAIEEILEDC